MNTCWIKEKLMALCEWKEDDNVIFGKPFFKYSNMVLMYFRTCYASYLMLGLPDAHGLLTL